MKRMLAAALILTLAVLALPWLFKLDQAASPPDVPDGSLPSGAQDVLLPDAPDALLPDVPDALLPGA